MTETDHNPVETIKTKITKLMERNEALLASIETVQQHQLQEKEGSLQREMDDPDPQPLSAKIWNTPVPENFKVPSLSSYDGKGNPVQHVMAFNTRMSVVGVVDYKGNNPMLQINYNKKKITNNNNSKLLRTR